MIRFEYKGQGQCCARNASEKTAVLGCSSVLRLRRSDACDCT